MKKSDDKENRIICFQKKPICFKLCERTKTHFINNANRESDYSKVADLINHVDLFLFEIYYEDHFPCTFYKCYNNFILESVNYFLVIINQIVLLNSYFYSTEYSKDSQDVSKPIFEFDFKFDVVKDIKISLWIQMVYCIICVCLWIYSRFKFKFKLNYFIQSDERITRLIKLSKNTSDVLEEIKKNRSNLKDYTAYNIFKKFKYIEIFKLLKIFLLDTLILNSEINMMLLCIFINILYLTTHYAVILSLQIYLICNLSYLLYFLFAACMGKIKELISVFIFNYLIIYIFTWYAFYHLPEMFNTSEALNSQLEPIKDNLCTTIFECYLNVLDFGTRSGGGVADIFAKVSFKLNRNKFLYKFLYAISFHIVVVLILGNIFLGIIVDAFKVLRDKDLAKNDDLNNNCFVCNIPKIICSNQGDDFEKHKNDKHGIFNYIYFIISILHKKSEELNEFENYAIQSVIRGKTQWLPKPYENENE